MTTPRRATLGLLLTATILAACAQPSARDDAESQVAALNEAPIKLAPIAGGEWARCWIEPTAGVAGGQNVLCSSTINDAGPFVMSKVTMAESNHDHPIASQLLVANGRAAATPQGRAVLPSQFPLTLTLSVTPNYGKNNMGVSVDNDVLTASVTVASPAAATKDQPIIFRQPFTVWPIAIVERPRSADDVFSYVPAPYDVPSAPFVTASDHPTRLGIVADTDTVPLANRQHVIRASLIAPASGTIAVRFTLNLEPSGRAALDRTAVIDGPGIYIAEPGGLRKPTPGDSLPPELLQAAPPTTPAAEAGAPPDPANPCDPSRRPIIDPDATACGGDGQRCCNPIPRCANSGTCTGDLACLGTVCM
jgi:hypothetical protein